MYLSEGGAEGWTHRNLAASSPAKLRAASSLEALVTAPQIRPGPREAQETEPRLGVYKLWEWKSQAS